MIVDEWRGQGGFRFNDLDTWKRPILDKPGVREDDGTIGLHADVVVQGDEANISTSPIQEERRMGWRTADR
ncbi:hypothetical protein PCCS19_22520 [Paenibacillus sp. CCS19]|uniref:hypothetical protein n=1 Tax=Paenibacillus sp. CCS19 TaxID=3158387 RepID=UPI0025612F41|nr:hypothetical protein [Paenibacillus cellulosilyticus]GMK39198.1 hypothetical protein PCCS19_22520 [Paenibacillus cellulosilyticus]